MVAGIVKPDQTTDWGLRVSITKDQLSAMAATVARVFIAAALGQMIAYGSAVLEFSGSQWKGVAAAGIAAVIVVAFQWVNGGNAKYGRGYEAPAQPPVMGTDDVVAGDASGGQAADAPADAPEATGATGSAGEPGNTWADPDPNSDANTRDTAVIDGE